MHNESAVVKTSELKTPCGHYIGLVTLNKPKALNALDLDMATMMLDALVKWQDREDIACIVVDAEGDKAFCAGGDIVSMYNAMKDADGEIPAFLESFFKTEYTLDFTIHHYPKPIVVWGAGIVMGGGMGLLCGASHRIATQTSKLAMPEISIGLYPDVGGSYFLPRLPGNTGLFLGLTGAQINGADAFYVGMVDALVDDSEKPSLMDKLMNAEWRDVNAHDVVDNIVASLTMPDEPPVSNVEKHIDSINTWCSGDNVIDVVNTILNADMQEDKWLTRAQATLKNGSPITAHLVFEQCKRGALMDLADCFKMEAIMSCRCGESGEFQEGVRALLIDKDHSPAWKYKRVEDVPVNVIEHFFTSPWGESSHPLAELGAVK
jgi:enoyl-CoA hydratase/carnithine racemase